MRCRLYVVTDNTYARRALDELFKPLARLRKEQSSRVECPVSKCRIPLPVNACGSKLTRYMEDALEEGFDLILTIRGLEQEVTEEHVERHPANLNSAEREWGNSLQSPAMRYGSARSKGSAATHPANRATKPSGLSACPGQERRVEEKRVSHVFRYSTR